MSDRKYTLKKTWRAKRLKITVACDGQVTVSSPKIFPDILINKFVEEKWSWVEKVLAKFSALPDWQRKRYTRRDYLKNKEAARVLISERLKYFYDFYAQSGLCLPAWKRISIRDQKTRWGSCSRRGNLNFNFKIVFLTQELQDYIVVHELCHLKELNHSKNFWTLLEKAVPGYRQIKLNLKVLR